MATDIAVVKKLEWKGEEGSSQAVVPALGLTYTLQDGRDGWFVAVSGGDFSEYLPGDHATLEAAQAAAKADFEQRILSALSQDYLDLKASHDAAVGALRLHVAYEAMRADRGGANGPRGRAWTAFVAARDAALTTPAAPAAADAPALVLVAGRYYQTRDGRRVGPMQDDWMEAGWNFHAPESDLPAHLWNAKGKNYHGRDPRTDLVAEWPASPAAGGAL